MYKYDKIEITTHKWSTGCGDGCCYDWGTRFKINGISTGDYPMHDEEEIATILTTIGIPRKNITFKHYDEKGVLIDED